MSEREALARYHDWCASRYRKAATRRLWRSHCIRLVAVPVSRLGWPPWCWRPARHPSAPGGCQWRKISVPAVDSLYH
jgi:hypothetical protein